ncbi:hypothetical protein BEWA_043570 [Theileria equi strain WA]|uniref:Uncharacterized protein n=1 Tax=Theileria equi strain WA TaxID=1537102 RepID=L1LG45_THEEQ|nr:hypothetical protein BEWA_043570 [Theileria equi strain WA]EKX74316.1 hypothetical protein BEWA_043570 [Theileria equi strain WA]|eukprot:XP_004833768.1 hypothetical protein BEWA_043570 [Theileria equi strain WA]
MNKTVLTNCLNALNYGFSSDLARKDLIKFVTNQVQLVINLSKSISKIDIYDHSVINDDFLEKFFNRSTYIIGEVANGRKTNRKFGNSEQLKGLNNLVVEASCAVLITFCSRGNVNNKEKPILKLLSLVDVKKITPSNSISVLAGIHKSGLYKNFEVHSFVETLTTYVINKSSSVNYQIGCEISILLWHRVALLFMYYDFINHTHISQLKVLLHQSFRIINELAQYSRYDTISNVFNESLTIPLRSYEYNNLKQDSREIGIPNDILIHKTRKTLSYVVQSLYILYQYKPSILGTLKCELLEKLVKQIRLYETLRDFICDKHDSSDTHTKISLVLVDIVGDNRKVQHEVPIGDSNYTVDTVLTIK